MSVVIVDMHEAALRQNNSMDNSPEVQQRMLTLEEYLSIATKTIAKFAIPSVANEMLKSDDAIAFVAEHIMRGTIRWKPDHGRTLYSYHNQCAIWAIKRWLQNRKVAKANSDLSLDNSIDDDGNTMYNIIANKAVKDNSPLHAFEEIIDKDCLNDTQKKCLRMKFVDGMTYRAIGKELNKSGARIEQIVSAAISKLKAEYGQLQEI